MHTENLAHWEAPPPDELTPQIQSAPTTEVAEVNQAEAQHLERGRQQESEEARERVRVLISNFDLKRLVL